MKKFICLVLAIVFVFSLSGCGSSNDEPIETESPCAKGHSFTIKHTNTCETDGYKISTCAVCGYEQTENAKAIGHDFEKNTCKNCDYKATEISKFPLEQRKEIAEEIKLIAPFSSDYDTLCAVGDLYLLTITDLENNDKAIQSAIKKYNSVPFIQVLDENGDWTWVQHEPSLIEAEKEIDQAKKAKAENEELLDTLKISIEVNAEGAAWGVLIDELEAETTSNKKIAQKLLAVFLAYSYLTGNSDPEWEQTIFDTFKEKTGLEIDMSQALS